MAPYVAAVGGACAAAAFSHYTSMLRSHRFEQTLVDAFDEAKDVGVAAGFVEFWARGRERNHKCFESTACSSQTRWFVHMCEFYDLHDVVDALA